MRRVRSALVCWIVAAACSGSSDGPIGLDGIGFEGLSATADACEPMPHLQVYATSGGQMVTTYTGDITVSIVAGTGVPAAVLSGTRTVRTLGGVATFTDLSINAAGPGYKLSFSGTGLVGTTTSQAFDVIPGGAYQLGFTAAPTTNVNGLALPPVRVAVRDACGSPVPGATNPVTVSFNTNAASATLLGTTTANAVNGVASFLDLSVSKSGPGYSLAAASPGLIGAQTLAFTVAVPPGQ